MSVLNQYKMTISSPTQVTISPNNNRFFDTDHLKDDLKGRSVRGGAATLAGQWANFVVQTISTVILARLLTPADFGLITMVTSVTGFASLFKDLGLSMATVQKAEITHEQISVLFWVNVAVSLLITLITAALAPAIAWFYSEPRLIPVTIALSFAFICGGLTVQHQALLRRQMRFATLAVIPIVAMTVAVICAIIAAFLGFGYWSLVVMELARAAANAIAVWLVCRWWPGLPARGAGVRGMLRFGANLTGFNILNYFARNLDNVLIGRVWGAGPLGFYAKAYGLLMLPISQITGPIAAVAIPALSRLQNDPEQYRRYYYRAINVIAWITMPIIVIIGALSREVILVVLGEQWVEAAVLFKVLAFAALLQPVVNPVGWVYTSLGKTHHMLHWALFAVPLICISFALGLPWGALGVAVSYMICSITVLTFPALWWAFKYSPLTVYKWIATVHRPLFTSLLLYGVVTFIRHNFHSGNPIYIIVVSVLISSCALVLVLGVWRRAREDILIAVRLLKTL